MSIVSITNPDLLAILNYASPPVVGAFIGYFTNMVAIKMLFRPLRPWRVLGCKVPFTPGVIPSKRGELAVNIGEMVGEHLLTSKEIGQALANESFQNHLYRLIENRGSVLLHKDLGPLPSLIPKEYQVYFVVAVKALSHQIQEGIHGFVGSPAFATMMETPLEQQLTRLLTLPIADVFSSEERSRSYAFIEKYLSLMLAGPAVAGGIEAFVQQKVFAAISQGKTVAEIMPESLRNLVIDSLEKQTPSFLDHLAALAKEPEIREKLVKGVRGAVEHFIASMGPMASMVKSFVSMETVEKKVGEYLIEKEEDIDGWFHNDEMQQRVAAFLRERSQDVLETPLSAILQEDQAVQVERFCSQLSRQLTDLLRGPEISAALATMIWENLETRMEGGALSLGESLWDLMGDRGMDKGKAWVKKEALMLFRSEGARKALNGLTQALLQKLLDRPIGRLAALLPSGVRDGLYRSIQQMASDMLSAEVPGLVASLNLKQIVQEKVDSLDLLRLERLLLSIMEEQFKYINLFGAILGFIIGGLNVLVMVAGR